MNIYMEDIDIKKQMIGSDTFKSFKGATYTEEEFKVRYDEVECKYSITKLRVERNRLLTESDWTQSRDLKLEDDDKWISYRQALRDLPSHYSGVVYDMAGNFINVVFPAKPEEPVVVQEEEKVVKEVVGEKKELI